MATSSGKGAALEAVADTEESDEKLPVIATIGEINYTDEGRYKADLDALRKNVENAEAKLDAALEYVEAREAALKDAKAELAAAEGN